MGFSLKRQSVSKEIVKIVSRQWTYKELEVHSMTKKNFKEMERVIAEIEEFSIPRNFVKKKLPGKIGYGIFLHPEAKAIEKGEVIAPYAGEVFLIPQNGMDNGDYAFDPVTDLILTKEEQEKFDRKNSYHPRRLYALKLDALKKGNFTRFINHSNKPNVVAYLVSSKKNPYEIVYFARKKILPGEQLLVSYEDGESTYWKPLGIRPFPMTPQTFRIDKKLKLVSRSGAKLPGGP